MRDTPIDIPHETYTLDNGLTVILHTDHTLPQVVVNLWFDVGSKDEAPGRSGFAHLFEHLMFTGTTRLPDATFDELMEAHGGWNNAWTAEDATDYYDVGPSHLVDTLLWMEADRMQGLAAAMTQDKLDRQRDVVRNERRQTTEDTPYGAAWNELPELCYPPGHPYAHSVIGSHEDLVAATLDDVVDFFETWYVPNNASLVVAGDFDPASVKATIQRYFGGLPARPLPPRWTGPVPALPQQAVTERTDRVNIPLSILTWHTPAAYQPGDAAYDVLGALLGGGRASRLYDRLVQTDGVALEITAEQHSQALSSQFFIELKPADGVAPEALEDRALAIVAQLAAEGPTEAELERVHNQLEVSFLQGLESLTGRASRLNRYQASLGDPGYLAADLQRYRAVTAADVQAAAARLTRDSAAIVRVRPDPGEE